MLRGKLVARMHAVEIIASPPWNFMSITFIKKNIQLEQIETSMKHPCVEVESPWHYNSFRVKIHTSVNLRTLRITLT